MKKTLLFVITTFSVVINANEYSFLEKKDAVVDRLLVEDYRLGLSDEYQSHGCNNESQAIDVMLEYEACIVDNVKPPVVSKPVAFLTHLGCAALIRYIALQEKAKVYFVEIKQLLNNWFKCITALY